jgi:hypothetical protein
LLKPPAIALAVALLFPLTGLSQGSQGHPSTEISPSAGPVSCRVLETFEDEKLGVRAIIFHQRDKADGPRLGSLLLANSGKEMELETTDGRRYQATVFRVKSAFGRGLAMVPTNKLKLGKGDEFNLMLAEAH